MFWEHPPSSYAELNLWRVYVVAKPDHIWCIVHRWVKAHGNPFEEYKGDHGDYEEYEAHTLFQTALRIVYMRK